MISLPQVEENMKGKFRKEYQEKVFHGLCRIYPALWKRDTDSHESYGEEIR